MTTLLIYGYTTSINGPSEEHFIIELDCDGRGIEEPAYYNEQKKVLTLKKGLNTYTGSLMIQLGSGAETAVDVASQQQEHVIGSRWIGNFFHDEYGGPEGDIPRGSFWFRVSKLPSKYTSRDCKWISLDGSTTSMLAIGKYFKMLVAYVNDESVTAEIRGKTVKGKKILSHVGKFDPESNDCEIVEVTVDSPGVVRKTHFEGKWSHTQQNEKFCGKFYTVDEREQRLETGSFFAQISEISLD
jgi:hypothetical protein